MLSIFNFLYKNIILRKLIILSWVSSFVKQNGEKSLDEESSVTGFS